MSAIWSTIFGKRKKAMKMSTTASGRNILMFPHADVYSSDEESSQNDSRAKRQEEDFAIDEGDYRIISEMLLNHRTIRKMLLGTRRGVEKAVSKMVKIEENDVERRVAKLDVLTYRYNPRHHTGKTVKKKMNIPTAIGELNNLTHLNLDLCFCNITSIPPSIGRLQHLQELHLSNIDPLPNLPQEIGDLASLKKLTLYRLTCIKTLPPSIGRLQNLEELELSDMSNLSHLQEEIWNLTSLKTLKLSRLCVSIPPSIQQLQNLEELSLFKISLSCPPKEIGDLSSLRKLTIGLSNTTSLPASIGQLHNLEELGLWERKEVEYLNLICELVSLKDLSLMNDTITFIPPSIGQLKKLEKLQLHCSQFVTHLPEEIGNLVSLTELIIEGSGISTLPHSIGRLFRLESLHIDNLEEMPSLPTDIGNLAYLTTLSKLKSLMQLHIFRRCQDVDTLESIASESFLRLTKDCKVLGYLGYGLEVAFGEVKSCAAMKLWYALACNRARFRTGFGINNRAPIQITPKLWPLMLASAIRAFDTYRTFSDGSRRRCEIPKPDAIYQLLVLGRGSFVGVLANRKKKSA